jgi:hypothetical protein
MALPGRGSLFVVAGGRTPDAAPALSSIEGAFPFAAAVASGRSAAPPLSPNVEPRRVELHVEWSVAFEGPGGPSPAKLTTLVSWTDLPGGRFFSGSATYRGSFDWPGQPPGRAVLCFDQVYEAAEIKLNGRSLGTLFNPPWAVETGGVLRTGRNDLEVTVVNLPLNRFLGLPDEDLGPLRAKFGVRFPAPEEKKMASPAPSGLIGAVWIEARPALRPPRQESP